MLTDISLLTSSCRVDGYQECLHCQYTHPSFSIYYPPTFYTVKNSHNFSQHIADPKKPDDGLFLYTFPNSTINVYGGGMVRDSRPVLLLITNSTKVLIPGLSHSGSQRHSHGVRLLSSGIWREVRRILQVCATGKFFINMGSFRLKDRRHTHF